MTTERRIFLESKPVGAIGPFNIGAGHLYLVFRDVTFDNGEVIAVVNQTDSVIRGGPAGYMGNYSDLATETGFLRDSGDAYGLPNGTSPNVTPEDRSSLDITALLLASGVYSDAHAAWAGMTDFANALSGEYRYELPTMGGGIHTSNSNATILSVLNHAGLDVRSIENADGSGYVDDIIYFGHPGADNDDTARALAA